MLVRNRCGDTWDDDEELDLSLFPNLPAKPPRRRRKRLSIPTGYECAMCQGRGYIIVYDDPENVERGHHAEDCPECIQ